MRTLLYLVTALCVMVLAFWAYRENYRTQAAMDRMQGVQTEMAGLRERLGMLRAEWAFLNRPERLSQLVSLNADKLKLAPLTPEQFVAPNQVAFPTPRAPQPAPGTALDPAPMEPSRNPGAPPRRPLPAAAAPAAPVPAPAPAVPGTITATTSDSPPGGTPTAANPSADSSTDPTANPASESQP